MHAHLMIDIECDLCGAYHQGDARMIAWCLAHHSPIAGQAPEVVSSYRAMRLPRQSKGLTHADQRCGERQVIQFQDRPTLCLRQTESPNCFGVA